MANRSSARRQPVRTGTPEELAEENKRSEAARRLDERRAELDQIEGDLKALHTRITALRIPGSKPGDTSNIYDEERTRGEITEYENLLAGRRPNGTRDRRSNNWRWLLAQVAAGKLTDQEAKLLAPKALKTLLGDRTSLQSYRYHTSLAIVICGGQRTAPFQIEWRNLYDNLHRLQEAEAAWAPGEAAMVAELATAEQLLESLRTA